MTELEKIAYAKSFIDKLANGVNPIDDSTIPDGDVVNNVRLSRCFFYVSDILRQVIENGGITPAPIVKEKKPKKEKPKGGTKDAEKLARRLEREIEKQEAAIAQLDSAIEAAAADYQELTRLLGEKESAEEVLLELMEQWEQAQEILES